ncbi:MAG: alpha-L-fucosidase [Desulfamplus sp.]|nr:alpha-L-fucosidase [Desulfamplus sp.]
MKAQSNDGYSCEQTVDQPVMPTATGTEWFAEAKFGLFIHWGLYALTEGEWRGKQVPCIGEWIMHEEKIPNTEYSRLSRQFNPVHFDAREWVRLAEVAGMRYLVFTVKHHEGFAMFHSQVDPYNVVDATPFKRDVLAELAETCRGTQVKLCVYYSHCVDWHEAHGGNLPSDIKPNYGNKPNHVFRSWGNDWDFSPGTPEGFAEYLERKVKPQLREILTNYGPIGMIWFDTPTKSLSMKQAQEIKALVKKLQPDCLVSNRIGHGLGDFDGLADHQMPGQVRARLTEACITLNDTWGYNTHDQNWKSADTVRTMVAEANAKRTNLLLNIGPQPDGRFPDAAIAVLKQLAATRVIGSGKAKEPAAPQ